MLLNILWHGWVDIKVSSVHKRVERILYTIYECRVSNIFFFTTVSIRWVLSQSPCHPDLLAGGRRIHRRREAQAFEVCNQLLPTATAGLQGESLPDVKVSLAPSLFLLLSLRLPLPTLHTTGMCRYQLALQSQQRGVFHPNGLVMKIARLIATRKNIIFQLDVFSIAVKSYLHSHGCFAVHDLPLLKKSVCSSVSVGLVGDLDWTNIAIQNFIEG